jgi:predicted glycosyl hydrolase (DUF1957 family)
LHAPLPFIRHPEYPDFLEEDWFFEALTETYIPILDFSERLLSENVHFRYTINLSPTLVSMMMNYKVCLMTLMCQMTQFLRVPVFTITGSTRPNCSTDVVNSARSFALIFLGL